MAVPVGTEFASRAAALAERIGGDAPTTWRPTDPRLGHPRTLVGVLVRVEHGTTSFGRAGIVVLRDPDGREWRVWLLHAVLRDEFLKLRPAVGELVAIAYGGRVDG